MRSFRLYQFAGLVTLLLGWAPAHGQVVRYLNNDSPKLWTKTEVDTFVQIMNRRGRGAGVEFRARIDETITRPDTIIYKYALFGEPSAAAIQKRTQYLTAFEGKPLPPFSLQDLQGKSISSQSLRGKPLVINMWFTTCGPCIAEMPTLNRIQREHAGSGVVFLAMTFDSPQKVQAFLRQQPFTFRHIAGATQYCRQFETGYPFTIFVGLDGLIKRVLPGIEVANDPATHEPTSANDKEFYAALKQLK